MPVINKLVRVPRNLALVPSRIVSLALHPEIDARRMGVAGSNMDGVTINYYGRRAALQGHRRLCAPSV